MPSNDRDYLGEALERQQARNADRPPAEDLDTVVARRQEGLHAAREKNRTITAAYDKSVIGQLGLDREGVAGTTVNLATQVGVGAVRGAGQLARIVDESNVASQVGDLTEEEFRAFRRLREDEEALAGQEELEEVVDRDAFKAELGRVSEEFQEAGPVGDQGQATEIMDPAELLRARQANEADPVTDEQRDELAAYDDYERRAKPGDEDVLGRMTDMTPRELQREARGIPTESSTVLERLRDAERSMKRSEAIGEATDFSDLGYSVDSDDLQEDLGELWDEQGAGISEAWNKIGDGELREGMLELASKGAGLLASGAGEFIDNPRGFAQFMAEELGEEAGMAVLPGGRGLMTAQNISRATEAYNDGVQNFRAENDRMPNEAEKERLGGYAVLAWALDEVGDTALLSSFRNPVKSGTRKLATAGGRVPGAMAVDGAAEAGQTAAEGEARYDSAEGRDIFTAGMLGAGVNAGVSVPSEGLNAASVVGKEVNKQGKKAAGKLTAEPEDTKPEKVKEAEKTGDVSKITDPKQSDYAPDEAMRILVGQNNDPEATEETKKAAQEQAGAIMQGLEEQAEKARVTFDKRDPAQRPKQQARVEELKAELEATTDPDKQEQLRTRIQGVEQFMKDSDDPKVMKKEKAAVETLEKQLKKATEMQQALTQDGVRSRQADAPAESVVAQINQTDEPETAKAGVLEMVSRIQSSSESFTPEEVESVLSTGSSNMTPDQQRYLRSFSESQRRANALQTMEGVRSNVIEGDKEFAGIKQYRTRMNEQLRRGDKPQASKTLKQLTSFSKRHAAKAKAINDAFNEVKGTDKTIGLVYDAASGWKRTAKMTEKEREKNGGVNVSNNTAGMAAAVQEEAKLLESAGQELASSYRMASATTPDVATTQQSNTVTSEPAKTASVPTQMTDEMRKQIADLGYTVEQRKGLKPQEAWDIINAGTRAPDPVIATTQQGNNAVSDQRQDAREVSLRGIGSELEALDVRWDALEEGADEGPLEQEEKAIAQRVMDTYRDLSETHPNQLVRETVADLVWDADTIGGEDLRDGIDAAVTLLSEVDTATEDMFQPVSEEAANEAGTDPVADESVEETPETAGPTEPAGDVDVTDGEPEPVVLDETSEVSEDGVAFDPDTGEPLNETEVDEDPLPTTEEIQDRWTEDENIEPYGKLRPLTQALKQIANTIAVTGEAFSKTNLVQRFMDQRRKGRNGNPLPLVEVENFLSELSQDPKLAEQFLGREMTPEEENSLAAFLQTAQQWEGWLDDALPEKDESKQHVFFRDPIKFLIEEGELEENVKTAISAAAYDAVTSAGVKGSYNNTEAINAILGREHDHEVSPSEHTLFSNVGDVRADTALRMGYQILDTLGFTPETDAGMQMRETLAASLGARSMALLIDTGVFEQNEVTADEMVKITGDKSFAVSEKTDKDGNTRYSGPGRFFIKPTQQEGTAGRETLERVQEAGQASLTLLPELLGLQSGVRLPGFKPVGFKQKKAKNSNRGVPGPLDRILEAEGAKPHYIRQDALRAWKEMTFADKMRIGGAIDPDSRAFHKANRYSQDAKNADIKKQIENFDRFVEMVEQEEDGLDAPFFMNREVWKMQRVGLTDTLVNPQDSKIHRHLISMGGWEITVDTGNQKAMDGFRLALAEAYGVKTDSKPVEHSLAEVEAIMESEEIKAGVQALQLREAGEAVTPEQEAAIVAAAQAGGEKYYSLEALIAQAKYQTALDTGQTGFTVHLSREVDGKTNGPMLGQWQMGAATNADELLDTAVMGGFFDKRSGHTQVNEWAADPGNQDLYQRTARNIGRHIQATIKKTPNLALTFEAIEFFTGNLYDHVNDVVPKEGRNLVKNPVTILKFGASMSKIQDNVTDAVVHQIYDKIETLANDPNTNASQVNGLVRAINQVTPGLNLNTDMTLDELMEREFSKREIESIGKTLGKTLNKSIKETMEQDFKKFIERRRQLNKATKAAFLLYETAYRHERRKKVAELIESGEMPTRDKDGAPLRDLSQPEEAEVRARIKDLEPVIHTAFSKAEGKLANGIYLAKRKKEFGNESVYNVQASFPNGFGERKDGKGGYKYMEITGNKWTEIEPGVSPMILALHSLDSFIAASSYAEHNALNVHDALITGLGEIEATAHTLNKNTLKGLMNYSVPSEMADALERTAKAFADRYSVDDINQNPELAADYWAMQDEIENDKDLPNRETLTEQGQDPLGYLVDQTRTEAKKADLTRLQGLRNLTSIDQYSLPGGNYLLTEEDDKAIDALIAEVEGLSDTANAELITQLKAQRDALEPDRVFNGDGTSRQRTLDENEDGEIVVEQDTPPTPKTGSTVFGELGRSRHVHEDALVAYFEDNPEGTAGELLRFLNKHIKTLPKSRRRDFYQKLILGLHGSIDRDMPVRYLKEDSSFDPQRDHTIREGTVAQFMPGPVEQVYIVGADYRYSNVSTEVALHELVHAVTAQLLKQENPSPGVLQVKKDLESLLERARAEVAEQKKAADPENDQAQEEIELFEYGTSSVDELIAVGTTNRAFQRKVLNVISVATGTKSNPLRSGMQTLIDSIVKLVFRGSSKSSQEMEKNGMAVLIANVSMLTEENRKRVRRPQPLPWEDDTLEGGEQVQAGILEMRARQSNDMSYLELYDSLASAEDAAQPAHQARVRGLLDSLSQAIHGPFESLRDSLRAQESTGAVDTMIKSHMEDGYMPFASDVMASGFDLTDQQLLAAEQIELTVRESLGSEPASYRELLKTWTEAKKMITPESLHDGDWATATSDEKEAAQAKHNFLFKMEAGNAGRVNHLSRFTGLALASPQLYDQLNQGTYKDTRTLAEMKLGEAIGAIFKRLLDMFNGRMTRTRPGQNANAKVTTLAKQLVDNEAKHRRVKTDRTLTLTDRAEVKVSEAGKNIFERIEKAGRSNTVRNSRNVFVKAGGSLMSTAAGNRVELLMTEIQKIHGRMTNGRQGMAAALFSEARGAHDAMTRKAYTMLREYAKTNEHERRKVTETTSQVALAGFEKNGKNLDKKKRAALTRIGLRTDLNALVGEFTLDELETLVRDPHARRQAIKDYEAHLDAVNPRKDDYYATAGMDLGYRMATGHVVTKNLMHNVHNIAYMTNMDDFGSVSDAQAEAVIEVLDPLVSLYALDYSREADRHRFSEMMRHEAQRGEGQNGVRDMLKLYDVLQKQAKDTLFEGSPVHIVKGYASEIYDPYRTLVAEEDDHGKVNAQGDSISKADRLEAMGYTRLGAMEKDSTDPDQSPKALFVIRDGGDIRRVSGNMGLTDDKGRGTALHGGLSMVSSDGVNGVNARKNATQARARKAANDALLKRDRRYYDPRKVRTGRSEMAPILNKKGEVTGYHYLMDQATKDNALKRDNDFSTILGTMAGTNFDKPATKEQNREVVKALHEEYLADYHKRPQSYLRVSPDSKDPKLREMYDMLPYDTQQAVREVWGERGMWVRSDVLDITFGYRKWSLGEGLGLTKDAEMRNAFQKVAAHFAHFVFGPKVALRIRRGEDILQATAKEIKDFLVIKSGVVSLWNIISNMSLLLIAGVNPIKQVKLHREAIDSTLTYRRDSQELRRLKALRSIEYVTDAGQDIEQRILELEDALRNNKATHLAEEGGLMPTIVEDVDQLEDPFTYRSQFGEWVEGKTSKVWSPLKTAAKTVYMTHDTPLYQMLSETTQMSDFVARYVMYEHTTTRKRNPLSHEDALQHASEMFINYDIPTHRIIQYLNDNGFMLFTKYYIRIQRALMTLARDNPARFMMTALLNNMMPGLQTVLDSSALGRIGNPLDAGPLLLPDAASEALTVQAGASLLR